MNIVKAIFSGGCTQITAAEALWQWDQGQILQIVGLDLPDAYQVEFSNQPVRGAAAPMIGGVGGVEIPDVYLTTGRDIYAFVVLHSGETDRETEYRITIHVNARPQPTDVQPTPEQQGVIDQLIAALNAGVDRAEDAADEAEGSAGDAAAQAQAAAQSAISSASSASDAAAQAGLAATAKAGAEAAQAAAETAQGSAEAFAAAAGAAKAAAETAQGKAEDAQTAAEAAQAAAESAKAGALAAKAAAETAQGKAEDAQESAEQAAQDAHVEYEQLAGQVTAQGQTIAQHGQAIAQSTEDIADLDTELTRQKSAIEDLQDLTNRKAGMLVDSASGAIASFVPDSTIENLLGLTVAVEPVQDLHGYDAPWPSGGGKNLLGNFRPGSTINGIVYSINADGSIHAKGTATAQSNFYFYPANTFSVEAGTYTLSVSGSNAAIVIWGGSSGTAGIPYSEVKQANPMTFTSETGGIVGYTILRIPVGVTVDADILIQLERGSTATAWSPYENLCPISGWDAVEVERTGVNLLDAQAAVESSGHPNYCKIEDGYLKFLTGNSQANGLRWSGFSFPTPLTFVMSVKNFGSSANVCRLLAYYDDGTYDQFFSAELSSGQEMLQTYTIPANGKRVVGINSGWTSGIQAGINLSASQIELGTTASEYKAYAGNRYTIQLGQTIYGGTLTIAEDGSVTALVDRAMVDFGTLMWSRNTSGSYPVFITTLSDAPSSTTTGDITIMCSSYTPIGAMSLAAFQGGDYDKKICRRSNNQTALVQDSAYTDAATFKTAMSGVQLVYELATPIVIQLDPVTISTISGQTNNVWADAGAVSVEFAADVKTYIDNKIAAAVAAMS